MYKNCTIWDTYKIVVGSAGVVIIVVAVVSRVFGPWRAGLVVGDAIGAEH